MKSLLKICVNVLIGIKKKLFALKNNPLEKIGINWWQVRLLKNLPENQLNDITLWGHSFTCFGKHELIHGIGEIFLDEIYKTELPSNAKIIDCGAHIGISVLYFKKICPSASIIAFEPDEKNFELLQKNVSSYKLKDVTLLQEAVWTETKEISFHSDGSMSSKINLDSQEDALSKVKAVRLHDIIDSEINFLKLDIEGAEYDVLKDIAPKLHLISNLFIEYHGKFNQNPELIEILEILQDAKYLFYIKEASNVYKTPFLRENNASNYDVQLNIFAFRH